MHKSFSQGERRGVRNREHIPGRGDRICQGTEVCGSRVCPLIHCEHKVWAVGDRAGQIDRGQIEWGIPDSSGKQRALEQEAGAQPEATCEMDSNSSGPKSSDLCPCKKRTQRDTDTKGQRRKPWDTKAETGVTQPQAPPQAARGVGRDSFALGAPESSRNQPCPHLDCRLGASRT